MKVKVKLGGTIHPKYGKLVEGETLVIEPSEFGAELFSKVENNEKKITKLEESK